MDTNPEEDAGFIPSTLSADYGKKPVSISSSSTSAPIISGNMTSKPSNNGGIDSSQLNTLDESVMETIKRDLRNIGYKLWQVLVPTTNKSILQDWDLWGPLLFCLTLASIMALSRSDQADSFFASVFVLVWCGAGVVTLNGQLLGGKLTFFQSVCVLGYCLFPLVVGCILCLVVPIGFLKPILLFVCYLWSCKAATSFLALDGFENRRLLAVYPIFLFYFIVGWLILVATTSSKASSKT